MILNGPVKKVLDTKGGFRAQTEVQQGVNHEGRKVREFQAVALRWESAWACSRTVWRSMWVEQSEEKSN